MGGKVSAEYYREYRKTHPEYREREARRRAVRRATRGREDRSVEYLNRNAKRSGSPGADGFLLESSIVRKARMIVLTKCRPDGRTTLWDDRFEDLVGEVVVALCEDADPYAAMREWMRDYWRRMYCQVALGGER